MSTLEMTDAPRLTMLDDIRQDLAQNLETPGVAKMAKLIADRFCIPEEQVRPYILASLLQLTVATDSEFLSDPTSLLRRLDNMAYNVARAGVAAEAVGWVFTDGMPANFVQSFGDFGSITEFCAQVTKGGAPDLSATKDSDVEH